MPETNPARAASGIARGVARHSDCGMRNCSEKGRAFVPQSAFAVPSSEVRPKCVTNYIGSKQKLVDWIWKHTPDDVKSVADAFSDSSGVAHMYRTAGLRVLNRPVAALLLAADEALTIQIAPRPGNPQNRTR